MGVKRIIPIEKAVWRELAGQVPRGVACKSDRIVFEIFARLLARTRENPAALTPALTAQIRVCAGAFGLTPADRARVYAPPPGVDDPAAWYFDR